MIHIVDVVLLIFRFLMLICFIYKMLVNITEGQSEPLPTYYQFIMSSYEMFCNIHKSDIISDVILCWNQISIGNLTLIL